MADVEGEDKTLELDLLLVPCLKVNVLYLKKFKIVGGLKRKLLTYLGSALIFLFTLAPFRLTEGMASSFMILFLLECIL